MSAQDEQLLERAKWLIARFQRRVEEDPSQVDKCGLRVGAQHIASNKQLIHTFFHTY